MSINLQKGQKVELRKNDGGTLRKVMVGLGWDEAPKRKGLFAPKPEPIDCDASAFVCMNGQLATFDDMVYFGNLKHRSGCVVHLGDNITGEGDGDDEKILVELESLEEYYDKIVFVVNIFEGLRRRQHFGMIENAFIRVCDAETGVELCKYNLSDHYNNMTAMVFGELYRYNGGWKFNAIGQATQDNSVGDLAKRFTKQGVK